MDLVVADGPLLEGILDATHPIWSDGLSRHAYGRYNVGQLRTAWGSRRLRRYAMGARSRHSASPPSSRPRVSAATDTRRRSSSG
jgi:hypothetical protein